MNTVKPESIALFCLTPGGVALAARLRAVLPLTCYTSEALLTEGFQPFQGSFAQTLRHAFSCFSALIVIGATGIVVRSLAPLLQDKFHDPAVIVMDERGQHVISLLSGHHGGANALTRYLAGLLGADPVITTATDVNELAALDMLAIELDARMENFRAAVKKINQMLVSGKRVGLWGEAALREALGQCDTRGFIAVESLAALPELDALICVTLQAALPPLPVPVFKLVPKRIVAGIGCRRDTPSALLCALLRQQLQTEGLDPLALSAIGSISLKRDEPGLIQLAQSLALPFEVFSAEALRAHEHHFPVSAFVRQITDVGSVSGPAAWLMSGGQLIGETLREQGVTITLGVSHRC
ncbi:cobalt-precorrin 5A hydrolase [Enterobacter sp. Bisph1]|uniref:cobalt-precorrin 5A hydrolase n=1 Tax=Enterobacter sp. Bisph1 TaxID=1274399 RepID=UPI00057C321C|nr:cobalt-precorrin 5A hydrolase [Enterobacter sp. Bisph1]